ncbi:MAG: nitroreductase family protein [Desulfurococcaceae archaeon]
MSNEHLLEFIKSRRSIRKFKPETPPMDLVLKAIDTARYAPSAGNSQPWRFIVVNDPILKSKLASIHIHAKPLESAPLAVVVACVIDESPLSYMLDCASATLYFLLAAHAMGLGTVWIQALRNIDEIRKILNIPSNAIPVAIVAIGYPDETPLPKPRKPLEEIVYLNKYGSKITVSTK